jgi:hypothetical protein
MLTRSLKLDVEIDGNAKAIFCCAVANAIIDLLLHFLFILHQREVMWMVMVWTLVSSA